MVRKIGRFALVGAVLVTLGVVAGGNAVISAVFGWALMGYLLWRAWPGVRADLGRLRGGLRLPRGFRRRQRGVYS